MNNVHSGSLDFRKDEFPEFLYCLGKFRGGDILTEDTPDRVRRALKWIYDGCDDAVKIEEYDFGGWKPLLSKKMFEVRR